MNKTNTRKALSPAYRKHKPLRKDINEFVNQLTNCLSSVEAIDKQGESEEHIKDPIKAFLKKTFYKDYYINTKDNIDLAIYNGSEIKSDVAVLIEVKRPSNTTEFLTTEKLNRKALHELLLYYLDKRIKHDNNNIKHLIVTNGYQWFLFKSEDFYTYFYKNKALIEEYKAFISGNKDSKNNPLFYEEIAPKYIKEVENEIPFVYLDFTKKNIEEYNDADLNTLYKTFSDVHILGTDYGNDSNRLNKEFYNELLHIIGLEEVKEKGKKIINRKAENKRDYASILENAIFTIEDRDYLSNIKSIPSGKNKTFEAGLELTLTWINRILFLKLLESQLLSYHDNAKEYRFLNTEFLKDLDDLNSLFFSALAKKPEERHPKYKERFKYIPHLNSSLFERNILENETFEISALNNDKLEIYKQTVLKDNKGKRISGKLNTLEYLFRFLDAYDFATDGKEGIEDGKETKTLINASILGLIFEKINGYKEGSFYTPAYITMYMSRETLRRAVVQKFKEQENENIDSFDKLQNYIRQFFGKEEKLRFNKIINSIRIVDPAVGSGHFLVSVLNELIFLKKQLGILVDEEGLVLQCDSITIDNDELYITDQYGHLFDYKPQLKETEKIQKTLFHEKQTIIENCLFGVDINPNSVKICRLRLWIELLKNAYYTDDKQLQTLPNIDINIKTGNSLISRFELQDDLKTAFKGKDVKYTFADYRNAVAEYKETNNKNRKKQILEIIEDVKNSFKSTLDNKLLKVVKKAEADYNNEKQRLENLKAFNEKIKKTETTNLKKLKQKSEKTLAQKEEIQNNTIYHNAFEWRFEFPEVLDDEGNYVGFDVVIGNPPYISNWDLSESNRNIVIFLEAAYRPYLNGHWDLFGCFVILGSKVLKNSGYNSYILPTSFYKEKHSTELRKYFLEKISIVELIDFKEHIVFDDVARQTGIYLIKKKNPNNNNFIVKNFIDDAGTFVKQDFFKTLKNFAFKTNVTNQDILIFNKLNKNSILLGNLVCINTGVVAHSKINSPIKFTKNDVITKKPSKDFKKYVIGSNLSSYTIIYDGTYMDYDSKKNFFHRPKFPLLFEQKKIIVRRISGKNNSIIACYDDCQYYSNDNLMHIIKWNQAILKYQKPENKWEIMLNNQYSLILITAIINSKLMTYFFSKFLSTDTLQGSYSSIYPEDLRQIPIKKELTLKKEIENIANQITILKKQDYSTDTNALEAEIDKMVYKLYELTPKEIKIIENSVK